MTYPQPNHKRRRMEYNIYVVDPDESYLYWRYEWRTKRSTVEGTLAPLREHGRSNRRYYLLKRKRP